MNKNWQASNLGRVCIKITDGSHYSPKTVTHGLPMASVKDMDRHGILIDKCRRISESDFELLVRQGCRPQKGDVLIAKDGATALDTVCEIKQQQEVVLLSSIAILSPDPSVIDTSFLRYYLDAEQTRRYMKNAFTTGAAIPRVVLKDLKLTEVRYPALSIQRKIAKILSNYDNLIENNKRRVDILEEIIRLVYREWFINFRFPGHENVKMLDSPLGIIPEGWEITNIREVIKESNVRNNDERNIPVLAVTRNREFVHSEEYFSKRVYSKSLKKYKLLKRMDFAFNPARINIGSYALLDKYDEAIVSPMYSVFRVEPESISPVFLWTILNLEETFKQIQALCFGTVRQTFKFQDFSLVKFTLPSKEVREKYENLITPMKQEINSLKLIITNLDKTRDLLLSKLISGELDVSEIDIDIGDDAM